MLPWCPLGIASHVQHLVLKALYNTCLDISVIVKTLIKGCP